MPDGSIWVSDAVRQAAESVTVGGWVRCPLIFYVAGTQENGALAGYRFRLHFERAGSLVYSLPADKAGHALLPRMFQPNSRGVFQVPSTPVDPRLGSLVLAAWHTETHLGYPDLIARCTYRRTCNGPIMFRIDPVVDMGKRTTGSSTDFTENSGSVNWTDESSRTVKVDGGVDAKVAKLGGAHERNSRLGEQRVGPSATSGTGTTSSTERPVAFIRTISVRSVSQPPTM